MPIMTDIPVTVDIGPWMKFSKELFEVLKAENALMAGMTFGEAATTLGYKFVSGVGWVKNISVTTEVVVQGATATEALLGASTATATETVTGTIVLTETATGGATAMGLGSMATALGAVCLAGAAGYCLGNAIGNAIDEAYPEFFDGLFKSISVKLTGTETGLAFLFDSDGHAYAPEVCKTSAEEYLKASYKVLTGVYSGVSGNRTYSFSELKVGDVICVNAGGGLSTVESLESPYPVYALSIYTGLYTNSSKVDMCDNSAMFFSQSYFSFKLNGMTSTASSKGSNTYKIGYYIVTSKWAKKYFENNLPNLQYLTIPINDFTDNPYNALGEGLAYRLLPNTSSSSLPEKTQIPSSLQTYEVPAKPQLKVYTSSQTEPETWIRIPLPEPLPDSETVPKIIPQIEPEESPTPEKLPTPVITTQPTETPTPSPEIDPSVDPSPKPSITPVPTPPPPDTGETPVPPLPIIPPISAQSAGLLHVYNPTTDEINEFGKWLWTTFSGDLIDTIGKLFNNPMDAVIGLHELYCTPITGDVTTIKAGFLDSDVTSRLVSKRYVEINCNAIAIPEYWGNYLDYAPYTKVHCYLPFIGIVELNPNDIIGHGVQVVYKVDTYNGSCIAMIVTAKNSSESVKYQFSGNCAVEVPITSGMKSAVQSALIGAGTCAIGAVAGGVVAGASVSSGAIGASAARGASQRGLNSSNSVSHSGSFGSSFGAMGIKKPYFIVERPVQKVVPNYNEKYGYPAHKMVTIGNCSGYLRCRDFEFKSSTATEEEKKLIEELLQKGVYV